MAENRRPFDVLDGAKGGNVMVKLKAYGGEERIVSGELQAFDKHLNIWIENASVKGDDVHTDYGKLFVRGDNVLFVSPE
ncbi:MAG: LSM domain-containing protein [Candidatus Nanohaloarchaea archaeon]